MPVAREHGATAFEIGLIVQIGFGQQHLIIGPFIFLGSRSE
jgi:hypothetical protein